MSIFWFLLNLFLMVLWATLTLTTGTLVYLPALVISTIGVIITAFAVFE